MISVRQLVLLLDEEPFCLLWNCLNINNDDDDDDDDDDYYYYYYYFM